MQTAAAKPAPTPNRQPGRPRKFPADQMRPRLSFRIREQIRVALTVAARAAGRSIAEEIEFRLEMSFARDAEDARSRLGGEVFELARDAWDSPGGTEKSLVLLVRNYPDVTCTDRQADEGESLGTQQRQIQGSAAKTARITVKLTEPPPAAPAKPNAAEQ